MLRSNDRMRRRRQPQTATICKLPVSMTTTALFCLLSLVVHATWAQPMGNNNHNDHLSASYIEHDDMCGDIRPQNGLDIQQMTGIWYGNELLHHDAAATVANKSNFCIIVEITQETTTVRPLLVPYNRHQMSIYPTPTPTAVHSAATHSVYKKQLDEPYFRTSGDHNNNDDDHDESRNHNIDHFDYNHHTDHNTNNNNNDDDIDRHSHDYLRLIWDDSRTGPVAYTLRYNHTARGTWRTEDPATVHRNGAGFYKSPSTPLHHAAEQAQPHTTFLVMKAVGNHVVMTMCETQPERRIVTITLSRATEPLNSEDLESVRKLLRRRHLSIYSREPLCPPPNAAGSSMMATTLTTVILIVVATMLRG